MLTSSSYHPVLLLSAVRFWISRPALLKLEESQAAAAVGQIALARAWSESLSRDNIVAGQILLTLGDTEERRRYLNARATINQLLKLGAVPIINENDTVATSEIRYGDNDRLAARVATMTGADLLILLSDIDGLYTAPPHLDASAEFLPVIPAITPDIEAMAGGAASELSRGGMRTKIDAGKIATGAGCGMIIASGKTQNPLQAIETGARFLLVCAIWNACHGPQDLDCRTAAAGWRVDCRCRCRTGAGTGQKPSSGGRSLRVGFVQPGRYGCHHRRGRPGNRTRFSSVMMPRSAPDCRSQIGRD